LKHRIAWHGFGSEFEIEADTEEEAIEKLAQALNENDEEWIQRHEVKRRNKMKLRKRSKYFVADPEDVRFGKRIPLPCRYLGRREDGRHDFEIVGNCGSGYLLSDRDVAKLVEPFSKERGAEVVAEANYYNQHGKLMPSTGRL